MSRIGKNPVSIPQGVNVAVAGQTLNISGKLGKHALDLPTEITVAVADGTVTQKEKARIEKAQDRQSRRIARQKHDKQDN